MRRGKSPPFFQESDYRVRNPIQNETRRPQTEIRAGEERLIALTLAKSGYFFGNVETIYNTSVDIVIDTYNYEMFSREYENTYYELNKKEK